MSFRIRPPEAATRQRRPRRERPDHLAFVRSLPCVVCGSRDNVHAAHVRYGDPRYGKRPTGMGEKPSDAFTVPLCARDHLDGPDAQHRSNERKWWLGRGIDPLEVAVRLFAVSGDQEAGEQIVRQARSEPERA